MGRLATPRFHKSNEVACTALTMSGLGSNPDFLLGGRTSASAECRHWSARAVRWSSCAILLSCDAHRRRLWASSASASAMSATRPVSPDHDPWNTSRGRALSPSEGVPSPSPRQPQGHPRDDKQESRMVSERPPVLHPRAQAGGHFAPAARPPPSRTRLRPRSQRLWRTRPRRKAAEFRTKFWP